jgi:drug/metabolite transporter (DMT)-like permease
MLARRPYIVLALVCSGWGTIGLVVRWAHMPATPIACSRIWIAAVGLGAVLWVRRGHAPGPPLFSVHRARLVATGVVLAFHWTAFIGALQRAPIGTVVLIVFLAPVGVAATAPRVLGERLTGVTLAALALAVAGFALVAGPAARAAGGSGLAFAIAAGASMVVLMLLSKPLSEVYGGLRLAFCEVAVAGVVLIPVGALSAWGPASASWLWIVVLGLVHTAVGVSLYLVALARVPVTHAGILGYLEPAGAVVCGWLVLGEHLGAGELAGGALIVLAGWIIVKASRPSASQLEVIGFAG